MFRNSWRRWLAGAFQSTTRSVRCRSRRPRFRPSLEVLEDRLAPAVITVTTTADDNAVDGTVSLREAILSINQGKNVNKDVAASGTYGSDDTIRFNIPGAGVQTIKVGSSGNGALPAITRPVTINGYTQPKVSANIHALTDPDPSDTAVLLIELSGANAGFADGLVINGGNSLVEGLIINRFQGTNGGAAGAGINLASNGNTVAGNFLGTTADGTAAAGLGFDCVEVSGTGNTIGGTIPPARNVIAGATGVGGPGRNIRLAGNGNSVLGNFIGINAAGNAALGSTSTVGVEIAGASNNTIGGNVISGASTTDGVLIQGSAATGNVVAGNLIGTKANGREPLGNRTGVLISFAPGNTVGGTTDAARNIISGNDTGVQIDGDAAARNVVEGNYIGTNKDGTSAVANGTGISITGDAPKNTIGGITTTPGQGPGNVISGNRNSGIFINTGFLNQIQGNLIGILANGGIRGNATGVQIYVADNNTVGGTADGTANTIAFNAQDGVSVSSATGNSATRNAILSNSMFANGALGIDLVPVAGGNANNYQNAPAISAATVSGSNLSITYSVKPTANGKNPLRVEFFKADAAGQGQVFLGFDSYGDSAGGPKTATIMLPGSVALASGDKVVATATDANNNTSEFSAVPQVVQAAVPARITATDGSGQSARASTPFGTALRATVTDAAGNPLGGIRVTFAVVAGSDGAGGTFGGDTTVTTDAQGVATAPGLTANEVVGDFSVTATVSGISPATFTLTNTAPPPLFSPGPPPLPAPRPIVVVGSEFNNSSLVTVYDARTGMLIARFLAYGPFRGGVRVAVADVNGDGVPDIITGAGPGAGPHVKVFDGSRLGELNTFDVNYASINADSILLASFLAYSPGNDGGVYVAAGDVSGNGKADVITGPGTGEPEVRLFRESSRFDLGLFGFVDSSQFIGVGAVELTRFSVRGPGFRTNSSVRVASVDVAGNGLADIIVAPGIPSSRGAVPTAFIFGVSGLLQRPSLDDGIDSATGNNISGLYVGGG